MKSNLGFRQKRFWCISPVALNHSTVDFLIFITFSFALDNSTCYMRALRMKHIFNSDLLIMFYAVLWISNFKFSSPINSHPSVTF